MPWSSRRSGIERTLSDPQGPNNTAAPRFQTATQTASRQTGRDDPSVRGSIAVRTCERICTQSRLRRDQGRQVTVFYAENPPKKLFLQPCCLFGTIS